MSIYAFERGPKYRPLTPQTAWDSALSQPLGFGSNLFEQTIGGTLQSFGLGTTIRDMAIPQGNVERSPLQIIDALTPGVGMAKEAIRGLSQNFINPDQPSLTEDEWKASPSYRENIPYDPGMTEARAKALAEWDDVRKVREHFASKRPFSSFVGNLAGQALDPINYVPVVSPLVRAAAVAKAGRVAGTAAIGSLDAAANTALAAGVTYDQRGSYGDDVSWQGTISEIAMAAIIGGAFGTIGGAIGARQDARALRDATERLSTLKTTQEARIALNEAIDGIVSGDDIRLSPNATEPLARVAADVETRMSEFIPPIQRPEFKAWFGDSKVVDEAGQPKVLYKGMNTLTGGPTRNYKGDIVEDAPWETIKTFNSPGNPHAGFFSDSPEVASRFADAFSKMLSEENPAAVYPVYVNIKNPRIIDAQGKKAATVQFKGSPGWDNTDFKAALADDAYDGVIIMNTADEGNVYIPKKSNQIKSVNNSGRFDPDSDDLLDASPNYLTEATAAIRKRAIDTSPARPDPIPEGRAKAEAALAKAETYKATAEQYRVDPETGSYVEEAEIKQLEIEGRLTAEDRAELEAAAMIHENGVAYGNALKAAANCLI